MSHDSWTAVQSTVILCTKVLPLNVCFSLQTFGFWRKTNVKFVLWIHTLKWSESDSIFHYSTSKTHAYAHPHIHIYIFRFQFAGWWTSAQADKRWQHKWPVQYCCWKCTCSTIQLEGLYTPGGGADECNYWTFTCTYTVSLSKEKTTGAVKRLEGWQSLQCSDTVPKWRCWAPCGQKNWFGL